MLCADEGIGIMNVLVLIINVDIRTKKTLDYNKLCKYVHVDAVLYDTLAPCILHFQNKNPPTLLAAYPYYTQL